MDLKSHWNDVYLAKGPEHVSWYQPTASISLELIRHAAPPPNPAIIDVGGGASTLVDGLLAAGYRRITVLDLSAIALADARKRIGEAAAEVTWLEADVLTADFPRGATDVWHDRAVFHFLTSANARARYVAQVKRSVRPGGHVLVATFAEDGPDHCSGLEVVRYSPERLHSEFGADFQRIATEREHHLTPWGTRQAFTYCLCRYMPVDVELSVRSAA
ncbi:MAG: class I SAM-dependent methyltransferase [Gemmatimonadaceae bacterium]